MEKKKPEYTVVCHLKCELDTTFEVVVSNLSHAHIKKKLLGYCRENFGLTEVLSFISY